MPFDQVEATHDAARGMIAMEARMVADLSASTNGTSWVDATLQRLQCPVER
jgi:hypothetical protein